MQQETHEEVTASDLRCSTHGQARKRGGWLRRCLVRFTGGGAPRRCGDPPTPAARAGCAAAPGEGLRPGAPAAAAARASGSGPLPAWPDAQGAHGVGSSGCGELPGPRRAAEEPLAASPPSCRPAESLEAEAAARAPGGPQAQAAASRHASDVDSRVLDALACIGSERPSTSELGFGTLEPWGASISRIATPLVSSSHDIPAWASRDGKEPIPMELLDEHEQEQDGLPRAETEGLLPPLPPAAPPQAEGPPGRARPGGAAPRAPAEAAAAAERPEEPAPPQPRPRSFRRPSAPEGPAVGKPGAPAASSSRPTTASAGSASAHSTSRLSASWREEWTPGGDPPARPLSSQRADRAPAPAPTPPPAPPPPPLPLLDPSLHWRPQTGLSSSGRSPSSPRGLTSPAVGQDSGDLAYRDSAIRRMGESVNVEAATPPASAYKRSGRRGAGAEREGERRRPGAAEGGGRAGAPAGAVGGGAGRGAERGAKFSELARAFASLDEDM